VSGALASQNSLLPRPPGGNTKGAVLALIVHAGLIAALTYGVAWRSPAPDVVSAELWAAVPQTAAPKAAEPVAPAPPVVKAPPPAPTPTPAPAPKAALPDPQIAIEKARKEAAAKQEKLEREKELQAKAEREKQQREQKQKEAAEQARVDQQREENLKRMLGQIASSPGGRGTASADAAPSASYAGRLVRAIKPNIVLTDTIVGDPAAEVEVRAAPNGTVIGRRLLKSSGSKEWDEAVLRAIDRTETLPRDTDGRVPATLVISFRPRD
jgi:colicin import membrane protein